MNNAEARADLSKRVSAYQVALALRSPSTRRVGPFCARFDENPNPYNNYAIPLAGAKPSAADIAGLIQVYGALNRQARLEYVAASAPAVEPALVAAGFVAEDRPALMACSRGMEKTLPAPDGIGLVSPSSDEDLLAVLAAQREAFGAPSPPGPADIAGLRANIKRGTIPVLARLVATGEAAGGGVCTPLEGGVTEIAGIGVRPSFRRRGIAGALTARLAAEAFSRGATLSWLTPGGDEAQRIYARAGFQSIGELLMISLPPGASRSVSSGYA